MEQKIDMERLDNIEKTIIEMGLRNVRFELLDINGIARSKTIRSRHFKNTALSGVMFPTVVFAWDAKSEIAFDSKLIKKYHCGDVVFHPDLSTFEVLPWVKDTARVYVSASTISNGDKALVDPKNIALAQIENLKNRNLSIFSSFEHEFWVVDKKTMKPITDGVDCFSTLRLSAHQPFFDNIADNLSKVGVDIECVETEYAKGQFEITICPTFGIQAADNAATFRTGVKEMCLQGGFLASFMSKPYLEEEGSSAHFNHSLWSLDGKTQQTGDPSRKHGLSEIGEYWMAGLLKHAPALSVLQSPTLSCRYRFQPGTFAPFNATWGVDNRTCAIRLKLIGDHGVHFENRLGSSAGNPYISLAANIAAGIDGIDRKLPLPPPIPMGKTSDEAAFVPSETAVLPTNMESALEILKKDEIIVKAIGTDFIDCLDSVRHVEMKKCTGDESDIFQQYRNLYFEYI